MDTVDLATLERIPTIPLPAVRGQIRHSRPVEQAALIRRLVKDLGIRNVSVTSKNYCVRINLPQAVEYNDPAHQAAHDELWKAGRGGTDCPLCDKRYKAHQAMHRIVLAAFPDMDDRSETRSDYFDFKFVVD
jgi:hypothetical protein